MDGAAGAAGADPTARYRHPLHTQATPPAKKGKKGR